MEWDLMGPNGTCCMVIISRTMMSVQIYCVIFIDILCQSKLD